MGRGPVRAPVGFAGPGPVNSTTGVDRVTRCWIHASATGRRATERAGWTARRGGDGDLGGGHRGPVAAAPRSRDLVPVRRTNRGSKGPCPEAVAARRQPARASGLEGSLSVSVPLPPVRPLRRAHPGSRGPCPDAVAARRQPVRPSGLEGRPGPRSGRRDRVPVGTATARPPPRRPRTQPAPRSGRPRPGVPRPAPPPPRPHRAPSGARGSGPGRGSPGSGPSAPSPPPA